MHLACLELGDRSHTYETVVLQVHVYHDARSACGCGDDADIRGLREQGYKGEGEVSGCSRILGLRWVVVVVVVGHDGDLAEGSWRKTANNPDLFALVH